MVNYARKKKDLTIIVPALNEEGAIEKVVKELIDAGDQYLDNYEIIIFNDGSSDNTDKIVSHLASIFLKIRGIHYRESRGLSFIFQEGINLAKFDNIAIIPGDGAFNIEGIRGLFKAIGLSDMVLSYRINQKNARSPIRFFLTRAYFHINNFIFKLDLKDINSIAVFPKNELKKIKFSSKNISFFLEIIVTLVHKKISYTVVPMTLNPENHTFGRSLSIRSFIDVVRVTYFLLYSTYVKR